MKGWGIFDALNRTNRFEADAMGRRTKHILPGGQSESWGFDLVGNETRHTNFNSVVITNQFDLMNHCTNRSSTGYFASFAFSPTGQRTNVTDQSGTATYQYNARDCLTNKVVAWSGGPVVSLSYGLDANGNVTNIWSSSTGGVNLQYSLDALNRITNMLAGGSQAASYGFDTNGNVQSIRYANGVTNLCQYDRLNRLTNSVWQSNQLVLASFYYQLGKTGNRTNLTETLLTSVTNRTYNWSQDSLYRLSTETISGLGSTTYGLDPVGNRTNRTAGLDSLPAQSFSYGTNDWLLTDAYDSNGNTLWSTNGGTATGPYYYNVEDRLTNYNNTVFLTYNGEGSRVKKTVGGTNFFYLVDDRNPTGYPQVLEEWTASSGTTNLSRVYNYGLQLISQRQPNVSTNYFVFDGHGSTRLLADSGGNVVNAFTFDGYGNLIASNTAPQTVYLYCGEYFDFNLGFYHLRAPREYNPQIGRFTTADSWEGNQTDPQSLHRYTWCADNPVNLVDPSGHDWESISMAATTGIILGLSSWMLSPITANAPGNPEDASNPAYARNDADMIVNIIGGHLIGKVVGFGAGALKVGYSKIVSYVVQREGPIASVRTATRVELGPSTRASFEGGLFIREPAKTDMIVYRAEGGSSRQFGPFFGTEKPVSAVDAEEMSNIFKWGNEATTLSTYRIPKGTVIFKGRVAGGAGQQIYIPNPKAAGVQLISSEPLPLKIVNPSELPPGSIMD